MQLNYWYCLNERSVPLWEQQELALLTISRRSGQFVRRSSCGSMLTRPMQALHLSVQSSGAGWRVGIGLMVRFKSISLDYCQQELSLLIQLHSTPASGSWYILTAQQCGKLTGWKIIFSHFPISLRGHFCSDPSSLQITSTVMSSFIYFHLVESFYLLSVCPLAAFALFNLEHHQ